ncbi:MAG: protein translocase subunit SecF [Firmicutes bacterium]|nr:protein translocase subunit SecF [Bacillota bacterium]
MKNKKYLYLIISAVIILAGVISICIQGLNLGIDFRGGTLLSVGFNSEIDNQKVIDIITQAGGKDVKIQKSTGNNYEIRFYTDENIEASDIRDDIREALEKEYGKSVTGKEITTSFDTVSATASRELVIAAFWTVALAVVCMLVYISLRFEWTFGIATVAGLLHDILITLAFMSILQVQLNSTFIAAMLTIVGYAINNTIVIFDRVRENNKKYDVKTYTREFVVKTSVKESFRRTLFSSLTTLFTIGALCVFGVTSVREFALPIIIGIISSIYSCMFINPFIWEFIAEKRSAKKKNA